MMNYFSPKSVAQRYAVGRPHFHWMIVGHIKQFFAITEPLSSALDVGCGTGLSTVALKGIAQNVIGIDASEEMIALASGDNDIKYVVGSAENLPLDDKEFDLLTLSQVFHWVDSDKFFAEANRVLRPNGWLIAYDNYISNQMLAKPEFHERYQEYLARYPTPPREELTFTTEKTNPYGFHLLKEVTYENTITFSLASLVDFLVTQSNVIATVEGGRESIKAARTWLTQVMQPMFGSADKEEFSFNAPIWYLQKCNSLLSTNLF